MQVDARRGAGIRLTNHAFKGCCLRVGKTTVNDGEQVDVAAAGAEPAGSQGSVQDH
jgi:hypothetical protein